MYALDIALTDIDKIPWITLIFSSARETQMFIVTTVPL